MTNVPSAPRGDLRRAIRRDDERRRRREPAAGFWRSMAAIGSVGWPIALLASGGALLGRMLDVRWHSGIRATLVLLFLGAVAGSAIAWRALRGSAR